MNTNGNTMTLVDDAKGANVGCVALWSLQGGFPDLDKLRAECEARGLDADLIPEVPSPRAACRRAAQAIRKGRKRTQRPNGGWLLQGVRSAKDGNDVDTTTEVSVYLNVVGQLVVEGATADEDEAAQAAYREALDTPDRHDCSSWLSWLVTRHVHGVAVRRTGGTYFVPPARLDEWEQWTAAVQASSAHRIYNLPAMKCADACELYLDSIRDEAKEAMERIAREMEKDHGPRWYEARADELRDAEAKQARYEALLGGRLEDVTAAREELNAALSVALIKAQAEEEAA